VLTIWLGARPPPLGSGRHKLARRFRRGALAARLLRNAVDVVEVIGVVGAQEVQGEDSDYHDQHDHGHKDNQDRSDHRTIPLIWPRGGAS
jgi:hypothetical protein